MAHPVKWPLIAFYLLALSGCGGEDGPAPTFEDDSITVAPASQWAGGEIVLSSNTFSEFAADSAIIAFRRSSGSAYPIGPTGTLRASAYRVDPTHFKVRIPPRLEGGAKEIDVTVGGVTGVTHLTVAGFVSEELIGQQLVDVAPQPWPWDHPTGLLGTRNDFTPVYVDARTGAVQTFSTIRAFGDYSPGTSYRPAVALVLDTIGPFAYELRGYTLDLNSGAASLDTAFGGAVSRQAYELSPGHILRTGSHDMGLALNDTLVIYQSESPWYLVRSPDNSLGTFIVNWSRVNGVEQLPLVDLATQNIAQSLMGVGVTDAAAWSLDGASLYLAARTAPNEAQNLIRVDPATGSVLATTTPGSEAETWWLAVEPEHGWLYDLAVDGGWFQLRIRDPQTLAIIGAPEFPKPADYADGTFPLLIPDPAAGRVHLIYETQAGVKIQHISLP